MSKSVDNFEKLVNEISSKIDNCEIEVNNFIGINSPSHEDVTFLTNLGYISLISNLDDNGKETEHIIYFNDHAPIHISHRLIAEKECYRTWVDLIEDLRSLYYENRYDKENDPEIEIEREEE